VSDDFESVRFYTIGREFSHVMLRQERNVAEMATDFFSW
jgi:hypothetical protein